MPNEYPAACTGLSVPGEWSGITPEWMTAALAQRIRRSVSTGGCRCRDDGTNRRVGLALSNFRGRGSGHCHSESGRSGPRNSFVRRAVCFMSRGSSPWGGMEIAPLPAGLERLGAAASPEVRTLTIGRLIDDIRTRDIRTLTRSTRTLVHPHIGNTYVLPDGDVGFSRLAGSSERELVARSRLLLQGRRRSRTVGAPSVTWSRNIEGSVAAPGHCLCACGALFGGVRRSRDERRPRCFGA